MQTNKQTTSQQVETKNSKKRGIDQITQDPAGSKLTQTRPQKVDSLGKKMLKGGDLMNDKKKVNLG